MTRTGGTQRHQRADGHDIALAVFDELVQHEGVFCKISWLSDRTGFTPGNVRKGITHLRLVAEQMNKEAGVPGIVFVSQLGRNGGIALTRDVAAVDQYTRLRARIAKTQLNRVLRGTVEPLVAETPRRSARRAAAMSVQVNLVRLIEDLGRFEDLEDITV